MRLTFWRRRPTKKRADRSATGAGTPDTVKDLRALAADAVDSPRLPSVVEADDVEAAAAIAPLDWALHAVHVHETFGPLRARDVLDLAMRAHGRDPFLVLALIESWLRDPAWQQLEVLREYGDVMTDNLEWQVRHSRIAATVGELEEADTASRRAQQLSDDPRMVAFRRGLMWEGHDQARAAADYEEAIALDSAAKSPLGADHLGVGIFLVRIGEHDLAVEAFAKTALTRPDDPDLFINAAVSHHRRFDWPQAEAAARRAVELDAQNPEAQYILGLALERQDRWAEAAAAFAVAVAHGKQTRRRIYRHGHALYRAGDVSGAAEAFDVLPLPPAEAVTRVSENPKKAFVLSPSLTARWLEGHRAVERDDWEAARAAFAEVARRSQHHLPDLWVAWGKAALRTGRPDEGLAAFIEMQVYRFPDYLKVPKLEDAPTLRRNTTYAELRAHAPIDPHLIVWESFHGSSISCNPKALFDHVVDRPEFAGHTHVWVVEDENQPIPEDVRARPEVIVAERQSYLYLRALATAGHLVTNTTFPAYFSRRPGQRYLNTWHGTPLKTLGIDAGPRGELTHANVARNLLHATHLALPNAHTRDVLLRSNQVSGLLDARVAVTGSPRLDVTLTSADDQRRRVCEALGLDPKRPIVFYAPTWRSADEDGTVSPVPDAVAALAEVDATVLVRLHHLDPDHDRTWPPGVLTVPAEIDTYTVLGAADVLVTDYSSLMFDYLPLGRSLVLHTPDVEEYTATRGLEMDLDEVPARRSASAAELRRTVETVLATPDAPVTDHPFAAFEDGAAAERVRRFFFEDAPLDSQDSGSRTEPTILIHAAMIPNGVTSSLVNLLSSLGDDDPCVVLLVDQGSFRRDPRRHEELARVPERVRILAVPDAHSRTLEQIWLHRRLDRLQRLSSDLQWQAYDQVIADDARRLLGSFVADSAVDFEGYSYYWSAMVKAMGRVATVYQHSTMYQEFVTRSPRLAPQFAVCRRNRPQIVSVSRPILEQNARDLADHFGVPTDLYRLVPNQIDPDRSRRLAQEPLDEDIAQWLGDDDLTFIAIGRLSIEKNHQLMIDAFAHHAAREPKARLLIVGSGFLETVLQDRARSLGLSEQVYFAGQRSNPFAALSRASCLVISSLHEGQPMVVLEAMILGTQVLSTDLPGVRDMTRNTPAVFVESNPEAMAEGMRRAAELAAGDHAFDADAYSTNARETFLRVALGTEPPTLG